MYIQIAIHGWPNKSNMDVTRIVLESDQRELASDIMCQLGGLFRCDYLREVDEIPYRTTKEIMTAIEITNSISPNTQ